MTRSIQIAHLLLPAAAALAGAVAAWRGGAQASLSYVMALLGGLLLGKLLALLLEALGLLTGQLVAPHPVADTELEQLEEQKDAALRAIKELELDLALGRVDEAESKALMETLEARALELLKELDRCAVRRGRAEQEIERAVAERLSSAEEER